MRYLYLLFFFILFPWNLTSAYETDSLGDINKIQNTQLNLLEIKENLGNLEKQKSNLSKEWEFFRNTKGKLSDFIRTDLTLRERSKLQETLELYRIQETPGMSNDTIRNSQEKREMFLQDLSQYLVSEKKDDFHLYVDEGFSFEQENKIIEEKIQTLKEKKESRTDILKMKIADNSLERQEEIQAKIDPLLRTRLDEFIILPSFASLEDTKKNQIFTNMLLKIQAARSKLESINTATSIVSDRITTFLVIEEVMQEYIDTWK